MQRDMKMALNQLAEALTTPDDLVYIDVWLLALQLHDELPADAFAAWVATAANALRGRALPSASLVLVDPVRPALMPLVFQALDTDFGDLIPWPEYPLPNLRHVTLGAAALDWGRMDRCLWQELATLKCVAGPGVEQGLFSWLAIQSLPSLVRFRSFLADMTASDFEKLVAASFWPGLEQIEIQMDDLGGGAPRWPSAMPRLRRLVCAHTWLTAEDLLALAACATPHLEMLNLSGNHLSSAGFDALIGQSRPVVELALRGCGLIGADTWANLGACGWTTLRSLDLGLDSASTATGDVSHAAPVLAGLERLDLSSCQLGATGASALAGVAQPHLTTCALMFNQFDADAATALAKSTRPALEALNIANNPLGDDGLLALTRAPWWPQLQSLEVFNAGLSAAAIDILGAHWPPHLGKLVLGGGDASADPGLLDAAARLPGGIARVLS